MAEDLESRIRQRAHEIWEREGRPEGRADANWELASEEIAIQENYRDTLKPNPVGGPEATAMRTEPVEPVLAVANQGEQPGLADQGEEFGLPMRGDREIRPMPEDAASAAVPPNRSRKTRRRA
ncbi:DUF2934 domain-containing protein [Azospirillum humicireducens]|uniref:DUF2934 domain-containing protein n=1 Tax=Azospirillum humicireducens TaxID=1226968 RepID=A0A160JEC0_9PROT|nr:DUF2934 domain-containing protein [Azospirillum humicireducens]ANC91138.1 DUF2934 domain-containing protein [Azospirillum humicireducens]